MGNVPNHITTLNMEARESSTEVTRTGKSILIARNELLRLSSILAELMLNEAGKLLSVNELRTLLLSYPNLVGAAMYCEIITRVFDARTRQGLCI